MKEFNSEWEKKYEDKKFAEKLKLKLNRLLICLTTCCCHKCLGFFTKSKYFVCEFFLFFFFLKFKLEINVEHIRKFLSKGGGNLDK